MRLKIVALIVASSTVMLSGCVSGPSTVSGTIERVGVVSGQEARYLKLEGDSDVYFCRLPAVITCAIVQQGDKVTMTFTGEVINSLRLE